MCRCICIAIHSYCCYISIVIVKILVFFFNKFSIKFISSTFFLFKLRFFQLIIKSIKMILCNIFNRKCKKCIVMVDAHMKKVIDTFKWLRRNNIRETNDKILMVIFRRFKMLDLQKKNENRDNHHYKRI